MNIWNIVYTTAFLAASTPGIAPRGAGFALISVAMAAASDSTAASVPHPGIDQAKVDEFRAKLNGFKYRLLH